MKDLIEHLKERILLRRLSYLTNRIVSPIKNRERLADRSVRELAWDNYRTARSVFLGIIGSSSPSFEDEALMVCIKNLSEGMEPRAISHASDFVGRLGFKFMVVSEDGATKAMIMPGNTLASYLSSRAARKEFSGAVDLVRTLR